MVFYKSVTAWDTSIGKIRVWHAKPQKQVFGWLGCILKPPQIKQWIYCFIWVVATLDFFLKSGFLS